MVEFHGWATIHETTADIDNGNLDCITKNIRSYISKLNWCSGLLELKLINGSCQIVIDGLTNHKGQEVEEVFELYQYIGKVAQGSYGILYLKDDEDINGKDNEFQVFALARGKLNCYEDKFLSPFIPIVEDEFEE